MAPISLPQASTATAHADTNDAANPDASQPPSRKRKRKDEKPHILHQSTFRRPSWSYFHLTLIAPSCLSTTTTTTSTNTLDIDPLTVSPLLTQPLTQYFGTTGAAIPFDILKTRGRDVWLRVPRQDARVLRASLSTWAGSCDADGVPGVDAEEGRRVRVAWRVVGEGGTVLGGCCGDGSGTFGG